MDGSEQPATVWFYDGRNANRWQPRVVDHGDSFMLEGDGWSDGPHLWSSLALMRAADGRVSYTRADAPGWRFGFAGEVPPTLAARLPTKETRYGGWIDRLGLWRAVAIFTPIAAAVVFAVYQAPHWIAPIVPEKWENKLGDQLAGDFGLDKCSTPAGDKALAKLTAAMDPDKAVRSIKVVQMVVPNAYAMPGGRVVIFHGLLEEASGPDEIAGIVGHEIGHVVHRDPLEGLIRELGVGIVLGDFGGRAGSALNTLAQLSYSREAENRADGEAIERLKRAGVSPKATAAFFARMSKDEPESAEGGAAMSFLSTHPISAERKKRFLDAADPKASYRTVLNSAEWEALQNICRDGGPAQREPLDKRGGQ